MTHLMIGFLLNPVAAIVSILFFAFSAAIFVTKHKKLSTVQKTVLGIIGVICLGYFVFILWVTIGFGSSKPAHDLTPYPPTLHS